MRQRIITDMEEAIAHTGQPYIFTMAHAQALYEYVYRQRKEEIAMHKDTHECFTDAQMWAYRMKQRAHGARQQKQNPDYINQVEES